VNFHGKWGSERKSRALREKVKNQCFESEITKPMTSRESLATDGLQKCGDDKQKYAQTKRRWKEGRVAELQVEILKKICDKSLWGGLWRITHEGYWRKKELNRGRARKP